MAESRACPPQDVGKHFNDFVEERLSKENYSSKRKKMVKGKKIYGNTIFEKDDLHKNKRSKLNNIARKRLICS